MTTLELTPELTPEQHQQLQQHKRFPERILRNALRTPDGTVLESKHTHDFVMHRDRVTDNDIGIDGGHAYFRRIGSLAFCVDLSVTTKDDFELVRDAFNWGTYGKDGKQPRTEVKLQDMTSEHIQAVLGTQQHIRGSIVEKLLEEELLYRDLVKGK